MDIGREGKRIRVEPLEDPFEPAEPVEEQVPEGTREEIGSGNG